MVIIKIILVSDGKAMSVLKGIKEGLYKDCEGGQYDSGSKVQ